MIVDYSFNQVLQLDWLVSGIVNYIFMQKIFLTLSILPLFVSPQLWDVSQAVQVWQNMEVEAYYLLFKPKYCKKHLEWKLFVTKLTSLEACDFCFKIL